MRTLKKEHLKIGWNYFMYKRFAAMVAALMVLVVTQCLAITPEEIGRAIGDNLDHPYLYFSSDEVPELRERVANDPSSREIYKELLAEGKRLLYTPVEKNAPVPDKNPRYSGNWDYHRYINSNRESALQLAFLYQLTGKGIRICRGGVRCAKLGRPGPSVPHYLQPGHAL